MDVETAIRIFATADGTFPLEAMRWALDHWDEIAPALRSMLERAVREECSHDDENALFFMLHLAGEKHDTSVFPLLCRLAGRAGGIDSMLGDGVTSTLKGILINTYDGDLDTLKALIEAKEADEFVRLGTLEVLAFLTASGRIPQHETEAYLTRLFDTLQPQAEDVVWGVRARSDPFLGDGRTPLPPGSGRDAR
jgi:Protein of unknown function (DUF1186)